MRIQIRRRGTALAAAACLIAAPVVLMTGLTGSAEAASDSFALYSGINDTGTSPTPASEGTQTIAMTVSPTTVTAGSPIEIEVSSSDYGVKNGPVAASATGAIELDAIVNFNGNDYLLRGPSPTVPAGKNMQNFDPGWSISSTPGQSAATSTHGGCAGGGCGLATGIPLPIAPAAAVPTTTGLGAAKITNSTSPPFNYLGDPDPGSTTIATAAALVAPANGEYPIILKSLVQNTTSGGGALDSGFDAFINLNSTDPAQAYFTSDTSSYLAYSPAVTLTVGNAPGLTLTKKAVDTSFAAAGDTIDYTFDVKNSGGTTITDVSVDDPKIASVVCPGGAASMAPNATIQCTGTYTVVAGDVTAGTVTNSATASGTSGSDTITSNTSEATVEIATASISLEKASPTAFFDKVGDTIVYTFKVKNTGNVTLTDVAVDDDLLPTVTCPAGAASLAGGASVTCSGSYTVDADDVDAGEVVNTATASGTAGSSTITSDESSVTVSIGEPLLTLQKSATVSTFSKPGTTLDYDLTVTNEGTATATDITVDDDLTSDEACDSADAASLAPGDSIVCSASYTTTQDDVDAEEVVNTAIAIGEFRGDLITSDEASATVTFGKPPVGNTVPSTKSEKIANVNCGNSVSPNPNLWQGSPAGGASGPVPTFTVALTPQKPNPGSKVTVKVTFDYGSGNGPAQVAAGSVRPAATVDLSGDLTQQIVVTGPAYGAIAPKARIPGATMTGSFIYPSTGGTVFATLNTIAFDSNVLAAGGTFNWPKPPKSSWSTFTTICNKAANPYTAASKAIVAKAKTVKPLATAPNAIGVTAAVPYEGVVPTVAPPVTPPAADPTDDTGESGGGLPQTGAADTIKTVGISLLLLQLGLILAVRSVRARPKIVGRHS